jgi:hypothetical protein
MIHNCSRALLVPPLLDSVQPGLESFQGTIFHLASIVPENQFWRWKDMWVHSLRTAVFAVALVEYLKSRDLVSLQQVSDTLGCKELIIVMGLSQNLKSRCCLIT